MVQCIDEAEVVIIGGGVIGASAAYHLTRAGIDDVLVLERNEVASGATARSAECFAHTRSDVSTTKMIMRTRSAIGELQEITGDPIEFVSHGSVRAVFSPDRVKEMLAMEACMLEAGVTPREIDAVEGTELVPWLKLDESLRTIFVPEDGYTDGVFLASSYAKAAKMAGARIRRGISVSEIHLEDGNVVGVMTSEGFIRSRHVVCSAGVWTVEMASSIGFGFPGAPVRSHYWITARDYTIRPDQPNVQLPDMRAYFRREGAGLLVGLQEPESRLFDPFGLEPNMSDMNLLDEGYDLDLLYDQASALRRAVPTVDNWGFAHHIAGLSMYTPDGKFIIGAPEATSGLIVAGGCCGSGLAASGGFGEVIASMITGRPSDIDASLYDPNRFGPVDPGSAAFQERCAKARSSKSRGNLDK